MPKDFRFIDLFAGIGGLRAGFDRIGGRCVFTSEWNTFSQKTYAENFEDDPEHVFNGDITKVDEKDIPAHDVLLAGFPCFPAGTAIYTRSGQKRIEDVRLDDMVLTHENRFRPVLTLMMRDDAPIWKVNIQGLPPIKTTEEHPFYVRERDPSGHLAEPQWVAAHLLREGQLAAIAVDDSGMSEYYGEAFKGHLENNHLWVPIISSVKTTEQARVYNIEVEEDNSYIAEGVVVHNCQPFSIAGVSKKNSMGRAHGFADQTQGTLFFDVVRILRHHKPKAFLLENVKNLMSHDKGNTFKVITETLDELGYDVSHRVISAKHWVPQNRERIFIVGFRKDLGLPFNFDDVIIPGGPAPKLCDILHPEDGSETPEPPFTDAETGAVNPKYTLTPKLWQYLQDYAAKHKAAGNGFGYGLCGPESVARTLSARYGKDGSEILIDQPGGRPRRLTPRECARLMGFDRKGSNQPWRIPVSDSQAYKQFGNAVSPPVSIAIADAMQARIREALRLDREDDDPS